MPKNLFEQGVSRIFVDIERWQTRCRKEERLPTFAFRGWVIGHVACRYNSFKRQAVSHHEQQLLKVRCWGHIAMERWEQAVIASFKPREAHPTKLAHAKWHIKCEALVDNTHLIEFLNQTAYVAHRSVERGGMFGRQPCNWIIQQAVIRHQVAA